jgi:hypothetical protein
MGTAHDNEEDALVVYQEKEIKIAEVVQKVTPLREMQPENVVVTDEGLYRAKATNLKLGDYGLKGFLFLAFYREINKGGEDNTSRSLSELLIAKFFGKNREKPDLVHDGKEYQGVWRLWSSNSDYPHYLLWDGCRGVRIDEEALEKMKGQLVERHDLLFTNEFLFTLYSPVLSALVELYTAIRRF